MADLAASLIQKLVQIASHLNIENVNLRREHPSLSGIGRISRVPFFEWDRATAKLSATELKSLFKLLVVCEKQFGWSGGSVDSAVSLFRLYETREPRKARDLARWALENRGRNGYIPFGSCSWAKSVEEWEQAQETSKRRFEEHINRMEEERRARAERVRVRAEAHAQRVAEGRQRASELRKHIEAAASLPGGARLRFLAESWTFSIDAFPTMLLPLDDTSIRRLGQEERRSLALKIGNRRGVWAKLKGKIGSA